MPKVNVYLPDDLAAAVRDAQLPVSAVCQAALERAVREAHVWRGSDDVVEREPANGPFARFTPRARAAVACGQQAAREAHYAYVGTEHLLLGILDEGSNLALNVLAVVDLDTDDVRAELVASLLPPNTDIPDDPPFTALAKKSLKRATDEAAGLGHTYVGCEHLLLGLLATEDGLASVVLRRMGMELRTARRAVGTALAGVAQGRDALAGRATPRQATLTEILHRLEAIERRLAG
jgi:ATP-dependent Clp protease ATP-binding subunit ClpC